MEQFYELLKYTIPALVVFATAYFMLEKLLDQQRMQATAGLRRDQVRQTLPLRIQAYERLMLLADRCALPNLLLRIRQPGMTVANLRGALSLAIHQEFDHNTSQQLYVSDTLWKILKIAREETTKLIFDAAEGTDPNTADDAYVQRLLNTWEAYQDNSPLDKAAVAIRTEAGKLF
jgi:hypothetical protein